MTRSSLLVAVAALAAACGSSPPSGPPVAEPALNSAAPPAGDQAQDASAPQLSASGAGGEAASCSVPGRAESCYPFRSGMAGVGACKPGTRTCDKQGEFGVLGPCKGAVGPTAETCGNAIDDDCDGVVDNGCADAAAPTPISASIEFHHLPDTAAWTNCLKIQVNGGPETDLGCNMGQALKTAQIVANAPPFCNIVRLNLYSNGNFNKTTANAADVAKSFLITKVSPGNFKVQCNDNYDDDFNDLNLTMNAVGSVNFTIENSGIGCN